MKQNSHSMTAYKVAMMRAAHQLLDHPDSQEWKRHQLKTAGIPIPESVTYTTIDLEHQTLGEQLQEAGFKKDTPSFFSWLGVTMYLTHESIMATFREIVSLAYSGSGITFDYRTPPSSRTPQRRKVSRLLARKVARMGEPFKSFSEPDALTTNLKDMGFKQVEDIGPEKINAHFFNNRKDKLMVGKSGHLMQAQI